MSQQTRTESDLGSIELDDSYLYGVQTARVTDNFRFFPLRSIVYPFFVEGLAITAGRRL